MPACLAVVTYRTMPACLDVGDLPDYACLAVADLPDYVCLPCCSDLPDYACLAVGDLPDYACLAVVTYRTMPALL